MQIEVVTIIRNEAPILPYFLRHYSTFASRIVVYDAGSTDASEALVRACPIAEWHPYPGSADLTNHDDETYRIRFVTQLAYTSHADWVMLPDCDELLYHPQGMIEMLHTATHRNYPLVSSHGYNLWSETFPTTDQQLYHEVRYGMHSGLYSKSIIVRPGTTLTWRKGRHTLLHDPGRRPMGVKLLHCKYLSHDYAVGKTQAALEALNRYHRTVKKRSIFSKTRMRDITQRVSAEYYKIKAGAKQLFDEKGTFVA